MTKTMLLLATLLLFAGMAMSGISGSGSWSASSYTCPSHLSDSLLYATAIVYGKSCYQFVINQAKDFPHAQSYCRNGGGHLAQVKSKGINSFLGDVLENKLRIRYSPLWIGLQYFGGDQVHRWVDGSMLGLGDYKNFMEVEATSSSSISHLGEDCVAIIPNSRRWEHFRCQIGMTNLGIFNIRKMFICEYPAVRVTTTTTTTTAITTAVPTVSSITINDCPKHLIFDKSHILVVFDNKCYAFKFYDLKTFTEADAACRKSGGGGGGRLVTIRDGNVNDFIKRELYSLLGLHLHGVSVWIGLHYDATLPNFVWSDGSPLQYANFRHATFTSSDKCVALNERDGKWLTKPCSGLSIPYLCEFEPVVARPSPKAATTTTTTTRSPAVIVETTRNSSSPNPTSLCNNVGGDSISRFTREDCPIKVKNENVLQILGDKCFYFQLNQRVTFKQAKKKCESLSGTLALAKSQVINSFLRCHILFTLGKGSLASRYWIGLRYDPKANPDGYYWLDESSLSFSNFAFDRQFECVTINAFSGKWEDMECHSIHAMTPARQGYICEFDLNKFHSRSSSTIPSTAPPTTSMTTTSTTTQETTQMTTTTSTTPPPPPPPSPPPPKTTPTATTTTTTTVTPTASKTASTTQPATTTTTTRYSLSTVVNNNNTPTTTTTTTTSYPPTTTTTSTTQRKHPPKITTGSFITRQDCPVRVQDINNIQLFGNKCFYFQLDQKVTFQSAERICELFSGSLALVKSKEINVFLHLHLAFTFRKKSPTSNYWIGLRFEPRAVPRGYYWVDGTGLSLTFDHFAQDDDDDRQHECATINASSGRWLEKECGASQATRTPPTKLGFICEFDTVVPPSTTSTTTMKTIDSKSTSKSFSTTSATTTYINNINNEQ